MNKKPQRTKNRGHRENRGTFGKWLFLITVGLFTLFIVRFAYIAINKDVQHVNLRSQAEQIYTKQLFEDYKPVELKIWQTFTDTTVDKLINK